MKRKIYIDEDDVYDVDMEVTECCGIEQLYNLHTDINAILYKVHSDSERRAMIIFHDAVRYKKGSRLANKIIREKLGKLQSSHKVMNPNSHNLIQMWIWYPDFTALDTYCERLRLRQDDWD